MSLKQWRQLQLLLLPLNLKRFGVLREAEKIFQRLLTDGLSINGDDLVSFLVAQACCLGLFLSLLYFEMSELVPHAFSF